MVSKILSLAGFPLAALAVAIPDRPTPCIINWIVDSQEVVPGERGQTGTWCHPNGGTSCEIGTESSYAIAVTVGFGAELGLDYEGIVGGLSAEYSVSTETATSEIGTAECSGPWSCALAVTPSMVHVTGHKEQSGGACLGDVGPYDMSFPLLDNNNLPVRGVENCACPDQTDWATAGAPPTCPHTCNGT